MIFVTMVLSAFLWGAIKGYRQWKAQQATAFPQRSNGWRN